MRLISRPPRSADTTTSPTTGLRPRRSRGRYIAATCAVLAAGTIAGALSSAAPASAALPPDYRTVFPWVEAWEASDPLSGPQTLTIMQTGQAITDPTRQANIAGAELAVAPNVAYDIDQQWYYTPTKRVIRVNDQRALPALQIRQTENGQTQCMTAQLYADGYHVGQEPCSNHYAPNQDWYAISVANGWGWYLMSGLSLNDLEFSDPGYNGMSWSGWYLSFPRDGAHSALPDTNVQLCAYLSGVCKQPQMLTGIPGPSGTTLRLRDFNKDLYMGWQRVGVYRRNFTVTPRENLTAWSDQLSYTYACPDGFRVGADAGHPERVHYQAQFQSSNMYVDWAKFGPYGANINYQKLFENYSSQWNSGNTWQTSAPNSTNTFTIKYRNWTSGTKWAQVTYFCEAQ